MNIEQPLKELSNLFRNSITAIDVKSQYVVVRTVNQISEIPFLNDKCCHFQSIKTNRVSIRFTWYYFHFHLPCFLPFSRCCSNGTCCSLYPVSSFSMHMLFSVMEWNPRSLQQNIRILYHFYYIKFICFYITNNLASESKIPSFLISQ